MKVLITTDWYKTAVNGVATSVKNLEKGLKSCGAEVRILTLSPNHRSYVRGNVTFISSLNADKIYPNARVSAVAKRKLMRELIDWAPDIIHSQCEFSTFIMARYIAKRASCPIVHTYHTIYEDYTHYLFHNKRLGKNAVKTFTNHISKRVDGMIAPTDKVSELLIRYGCHTPVWTMPTGLDLERITDNSTAEDKAALRKKLGIPEGNRILIYAGRLAEEKNLDEVIRYLGDIRPEKLTFLIVGDGPSRKKTEAEIRANRLDFAVMTGMVEPRKMRHYYGIADIFVSASRSETQGLTYIEALANGLPLLCRYDKCLENILIDGKTGYGFNSESEFGQRLETLLESGVEEMSQNARELVKRNYSLEKFAEDALKIYKSCITNYAPSEHVLTSFLPNLRNFRHLHKISFHG